MGRKKSPKSRKSKKLSWRDKASLIVVLLLLIAAGVFGVATAISKKTYIYSGRIVQVNELENTLHLEGAAERTPFNLRYSEATKFIEDGNHVSPSSKLVGSAARILYNKSLFLGDHATEVELRKENVTDGRPENSQSMKRSADTR